MLKKIAVLYSFEQKCFHTETVYDYIKSNVTATIKKKDHQYRMIGIAETDEDANNIIQSFRNKFKL